MTDAIPSLAPMIEVGAPPPPVPQAPDLWPWLALAAGVVLMLLLIWRRWRLWLWWQRMRVNERTAQVVARRVYGRLQGRLPHDLSIRLQVIAFAPRVSHETVRELKRILKVLRP